MVRDATGPCARALPPSARKLGPALPPRQRAGGSDLASRARLGELGLSRVVPHRPHHCAKILGGDGARAGAIEEIEGLLDVRLGLRAGARARQSVCAGMGPGRGGQLTHRHIAERSKRWGESSEKDCVAWVLDAYCSAVRLFGIHVSHPCRRLA
jgi:hypothetical protein